MAISVRLPAYKGPYIEHYLIQAADDGQLSLESSDNKFDSIPSLIAHYAQCWWVLENPSTYFCNIYSNGLMSRERLEDKRSKLL